VKSDIIFEVFICVKNGENSILDCLSSLEKAIRKSRFSIPVTIIDHNSSDETANIAAKFCNSNPGFAYVKFSEAGIGNVRNFALHTGRFQWMAFIDSDCIVEEDWAIAAQYEIEQSANDEKIGAIGGKNLAPFSRGKFHRILGFCLNTYTLGYNSSLNRTSDLAEKKHHLPTLNILINRKAALSSGGFDSSISRVGEDLDLCFKMRSRGYALEYRPTFVVTHLLRPDLVSWLKNMKLYGEGRMSFCLKHAGELDITYLAPFIAVLAYAAGLILSRNFFLIILFVHLTTIFLDIFYSSLKNKIIRFHELAQATLLSFASHIFFGIGSWVSFIHFFYKGQPK
jgi:cellulose synthase/poly-beta-1,6-N-acetylglucosamine synthase-like glycosyltransferase